MVLVENQVPFQLLKRVIEKLRDITVCDSEEMKLPEWDTGFWHSTMIALHRHCPGDVTWRDFDFPSWMEHIRKLKEGISTNRVFNKFRHNMHYIRCGSKDTAPAASEVYLNIPSATTLHIAGVTINGKSPAFLGDIVFENGCLTIPLINVYDCTEVYLRNLVVYEGLYLRECTASFYTWIMGENRR